MLTPEERAERIARGLAPTAGGAVEWIDLEEHEIQAREAPDQRTVAVIAAAIRKAVAEERDRCALLCEVYFSLTEEPVAADLQEAIRSGEVPVRHSDGTWITPAVARSIAEMEKARGG